mgnify:FL=1
MIYITGCWAPMMLDHLGVNLPQYSFRHAYVVTERIEGVMGMPSVRDHDLSIYLKVQGDVIQIGGYEPGPVLMDEGVRYISIFIHRIGILFIMLR